MPERIQLRRTKGWRLPLNAKSVARPGRWGNSFRVLGASVAGQPWNTVRANFGRAVYAKGDDVLYSSHSTSDDAVVYAVELFRTLTSAVRRYEATRFESWIAPLRGHDLACWCPLDQPCHADVLLEIANGGGPDPEYCALSQRVDGKRHSWKFDGDDPYVVCCYCGEVRSATAAAIIRPGGKS